MHKKNLLSKLFLICIAVFALQCENPLPTQVKQDPVDYSLEQGTYFRVISPNGGEKIAYGSTLKVEWVMDVKKTNEAVVAVSDGLEECGYNGSSSAEWFFWPRDEGTNGAKTMRMVDEKDSIVYCSYTMLVKDTVLIDAGCTATFAGEKMYVRVYDPYGDAAGCEECLEGDESDTFFSVTGK